MDKNLIAVLAIVFGLAVIAVTPLLTILAINTLFSTGIAYTFGTWLAIGWLQVTTFGGLSMQIRKLRTE